MIIRELNLVAFGPFTDRTLVFDQNMDGLHIVYGPNEAGKIQFAYYPLAIHGTWVVKPR